jgi:hypothetical protein
MKRLAYLIAMMAALVMAATAFGGGGGGGGGTGITATPASTVTWAGTYTAQFVRSASGIINETNRVNSAGPQNGWSPYDVRLQFRPLTNPTGGVVPNPACENPAGLVTPMFQYTNSDPAIAGTLTSGYFLPGVTYNVCVYYAHPFVLTLVGNGGTDIDVNVGDHVVYTGHYSNGSVAIAGAPVALDVFSGFGCTTPLYAGIPAGLTDGSGNYSYDGGPSPFGDYSVRASTANATSNCIDISVAHVYGVDLSISPNPVTQGDSVVFTSHLLTDGVADGTTPATVTILAFHTDSTCTTPAGYGPFATTLAGNAYLTVPLGATAAPGLYYYKAQATGAFGTLTTGCTALTIQS